MKKFFNRKMAHNFAHFYPIYLLIFCVQAALVEHEIYGAFYDRYSIGPVILVFLVICVVVFAATRPMVRDTQLAGLFTLTVMMLLFPSVIPDVAVYPYIVLAGLGLLAWRVWKRKEKTLRETMRLPTRFTYVTNVVAAAMLIAVAGRTLYSEYQVRGEANETIASAHGSQSLAASPEASRRLPNIVHIVLDGYSRADILRSVYGFDNAPFLSALRKRGFHIANKATTPFNQTLLVMSSIFSLGAVNKSLGSQIDDHNFSIMRRILARDQRQGVAIKILSDLGYELASTPSTYLPLQWDEIVGSDGRASILNHFGLPETYVFSYDLLQSSPVLGHLAEYLFGDEFGIVGVNYNNLKNVPKRRFQHAGKRPLFVYEHILAPHPPFNITADGRPRSLADFPPAIGDGSHLIKGSEANRALYRAGYLDKLQYINGAILEHIDRIKKTLPGPLIIILHGDHGGGLNFDQDEEAKTCVHERFSPLLAVYATDPAVTVGVHRRLQSREHLPGDLSRTAQGRYSQPGDRSTFLSWDMDKLSAVDPEDLAVPCSAPDRTWTARNPSPSSADAPAASISR